MFRAIRSFSCSRVVKILNVPEFPKVQKFRSIESFVNYQAKATTNFQKSYLQCLRPFPNTFEVNLLPILKRPHQFTTYISEKTNDFRRKSPKNVLQCRQNKEALVMNCSEAGASAKSESRGTENCPPCEPCPNNTVPPPPTTSKKSSKGGRLVGGLFALVAKFIIAAGVIQFSDSIGVWDNPTSWELMQIKWKQFVKDVEGIVADKDSFGFKNREK